MMLVKLEPIRKHVQKNGTVTSTIDNRTPGHTHCSYYTARHGEEHMSLWYIGVYTKCTVDDVPEVNCLEI